ncbi:hypothetical protein MKW92_047755 [Papaver armeniacum]|nr:hypothetical protein MKW92_047755 [Papaver armeniacum]
MEKPAKTIIEIIIIQSILDLIICLIRLIRFILHRNYTTTTTVPPSPPPPPPQIIQSPPIHHHSPGSLFNNHQIAPETNQNQNSQNLINSLPTFKFDSIKGIHNSSTLDCAICISKCEKQDELRLLPGCCHVFHSVCIDKWILLLNHNCPICRSSVKFVDDDDELKMPLSSSGSFRVEIGSVSPSTRIDESFSASDLQNRFDSSGSLEYQIQHFDAEIFVESENRAESVEVSVSVVGAADEATEMVIENRAESDEVSVVGGGGVEATELVTENRVESDEVMFYDRYYGGSGRSVGGRIHEDDGGGGGGGNMV